MKGWLFAAFILAILISVIITAIGLLANWGIWIQSSMAEAGKELPLLGILVKGVLIAFVGLAIELGRRWFLARNIKSEIGEAYLDLLSALVVLPTEKPEDANANFTLLLDHFKNKSGKYPEEMKGLIEESIRREVADKIHLRYAGIEHLDVQKEVYEKQMANKRIKADP